MRFLSTGWTIISKILFGTQQSNAVSIFARLFQTDQIVIFYGKESFIFRSKILGCFFFVCLFVFYVSFQDFAVLPVLIESLREKLLILCIKSKIFHRPFFGVSRFNLEVVSKTSTPPDNVIMMLFDPKGPKNKSCQITSIFISCER